MEISQLDARLNSVEQRLAKIENRLGISSPAEQPDASQVDASQVVSPKPRAVHAAVLVGSKSRFELAPSDYEPKPGNWLGAVAIVCFVLAAGFIIKLSIDSGWLTPARQLGLAVLMGISLIGAGFALLRWDSEYASLLPGAGIIILYMSAFAGHRYYALISFEFALLLSGLVSALCIGLYTRIRHDIYPITAAIGAYIAPIVLGFHAAAEFPFIISSSARWRFRRFRPGWGRAC